MVMVADHAVLDRHGAVKIDERLGQFLVAGQAEALARGTPQLPGPKVMATIATMLSIRWVRSKCGTPGRLLGLGRLICSRKLGEG